MCIIQYFGEIKINSARIFSWVFHFLLCNLPHRSNLSKLAVQSSVGVTAMPSWVTEVLAAKYTFIFMLLSVLIRHWNSWVHHPVFCTIGCSSPSKMGKLRKTSVCIAPEVMCMQTNSALVFVIFLKSSALIKAKNHLAILNSSSLKFCIWEALNRDVFTDYNS